MLKANWRILLAVLIAVIAVSVSTFFIIFASKKPPEPIEGKFTIRFIDLNGEILEERQVEKGGFAIPPPPPELPLNTVFTGWGGAFIAVNGDSNCSVLYRDISNKPNVFYIPTIYAESGTTFQLKLFVGGTVSLDILEIELPYNKEIMRFVSAQSAFGSVVNENDTIKFALNSNTSLQKNTELATITFKAIGEPFVYMDIKPTIILAQQASPVGYINADHQIVTGRVYQYNNQ